MKTGTNLDRYYLAFGSNLNHRGMAQRCPGAEPVTAVRFRGAQLVFRGVADLVFGDPLAVAVGGIWRISEDHEAALDCYEGVANGMYRKRWFDRGDFRHVLCYTMNDDGIYPPALGYYSVIRQGYRDFRLDEKYLIQALDHAWDAHRHSLQTWERRQRQRNDWRQLPLAGRPE